MTSDVFTLMRSMDAAGGVEPDATRTAALREQIITTHPRAASMKSAQVNRGLLRSTRARIAAVGGTAATAVAAVAFIGGGSPAYATWSANPEPVSAHDLRIAEAACGHSTIPIVLSERRGDYIAIQRASDDLKYSSTCVVDLPKGEQAGTNAGGSGPDVRGEGVAPPPADGLRADGMTQLGEPPLGVVDGLAGRNVKAITIHVDGRTMKATLQNGHYAAVWTGEVPSDTSGKVTYDITLRDGRVIKNASNGWVQ